MFFKGRVNRFIVSSVSLVSLQQFFIKYQKEFVFVLVLFTTLCNWLFQNLGHFLNHGCLTLFSRSLAVFQV